MRLITTVLFVIMMVLCPVCAKAYIGPGLGVGTIGVILGVLGSIVIALFAFLWYPIKRLLKKIKKLKHRNITH